MSNILEKLQSNGSIQTDVEVYSKFLDFGKEQGYISSSATMPMIIEIISRSNSMCQELYDSIDEFLKKDGKSVQSSVTVFLGWCIYLGMGVVYLYNNNPGNLSLEEICKKVINERTVFAMDEYVTDLVGIGFGSKESDELTKHTQLSSQIALLTVPKDNPSLISEQIKYTSKALFDYGCAIEMDRLGI